MSGHPPSSTLNPRRILVRGVNWLGDAVMSTPALLRLRERFPEAHITLLTPEKLAGLWISHPALDEIIAFPAGAGLWDVASAIRNFQLEEHEDQVKKLAAKLPRAMVTDEYSDLIEWSEKRQQTIKKVKVNFDLAFVLPNSPRSALEVWAARIPRRVGYRRSWRNWFLTDLEADRAGAVTMRKRSPAEVRQLVVDNAASRASSATSITPAAHHIHQYLHLVAALGANPEPVPPLLRVLDSEVAGAAKKFGLAPEVAWLALNPGAEYGPAKRWPAERFIAAAQEIQQRTGCRWLVLGGKGDVELAGSIAANLTGSVNLAGRTSLRELCAVLKISRVLLTNDTGPMHVGAALGTPVVALFGSTSPELTGPGLPGPLQPGIVKGEAPCAPCFLRECPIDFRCMNSIAPDRVVAAVLAALQLTPPNVASTMPPR